MSDLILSVVGIDSSNLITEETVAQNNVIS